MSVETECSVTASNSSAVSEVTNSKHSAVKVKEKKDDAEQDAIMSLLNIGQRTSSRDANSKSVGNDGGDEEEDEDDEPDEKSIKEEEASESSTRGIEQHQAVDVVAGDSRLPSEHYQDRESIEICRLLPQVFLRDMGKKHKDHPTVEGQFEDAHEYLGLRQDYEAAMISTAVRIGSPFQSASHSVQIPADDVQQQHQQGQQYDQYSRERRMHLEAMLKAHLALQRLSPAPAPPSNISPAAPANAPTTNGITFLKTSGLAESLAEARAHAQGRGQSHGTVASNEQIKAKVAAAVDTFPGAPSTTPKKISSHSLALQSHIPTKLINFPETEISAKKLEGSNLAAALKSPYALRKSMQVPAMKPPNGIVDHNSTEGTTKFRYREYTPPGAWDLLTQVPKMPETPADLRNMNPIKEVKETDVLLGRGGLTNTNPGNIKFRQLVSKYRMAYCTAPKGDKGALARFLCNYVRFQKGRFLRSDCRLDRKAKCYYEVGDEKAVMKCGQALREGTSELVRRVVRGAVSSPPPDKNSHKRQRVE
jgi:hypothetical protein